MRFQHIQAPLAVVDKALSCREKGCALAAVAGGGPKARSFVVEAAVVGAEIRRSTSRCLLLSVVTEYRNNAVIIDCIAPCSRRQILRRAEKQ